MTDDEPRRPSLLDRDADELRELAREVVPPDVLDPPMPDDDAESVEPIDLDTLEVNDLARLVVEHMKVGDLARLPEVQAAIADFGVPVRRRVPSDLAAAALGEMVEAEREAAALALTEAENAAAPSEAEVEALYVSPPIEPGDDEAAAVDAE